MIKQIISVGILFLLAYGNAFAEFEVYTIDNKFEAAFPAKPQFHGELGQGYKKHRGYNYIDEDNAIAYTAIYQVGENSVKKSNVLKLLRIYIEGLALAAGGSIKSYSNQNINGNSSAIFHMEYKLQGHATRKYAVISYKDGHLYQWSVKDFPPISSLSAENIFNAHFGKFLVK